MSTSSALKAANALKKKGEVSQALTLLENELRHHPSLETALSLSQLYFGRKMYSKAQALCDEFLKRQPENKELLEISCQSALAQMNFKKAMLEANQLIGHHPRSHSGYHLRALVHFRQNEPDRASEFLQKSLSRKKKHTESYSLMGEIFLSKGDSTEAVKCFEKAIDCGDHPYAHVQLGLMRYNSKDYEGAKKHFRNASKVEPDEAQHWVNLAIMDNLTGDFKDSVKSAEKAILLSPDLVDGNAILADSLCNLGRFEEAIESFRRSLSMNPCLTEAWVGLGYSYSQLKMYERAVDAFTKAISTDPGAVFAWYNLGILFYMLRDPRKSLKCFEQARRLTPDFEPAKKYIERIEKENQGPPSGPEMPRPIPSCLPKLLS